MLQLFFKTVAAIVVTIGHSERGLETRQILRHKFDLSLDRTAIFRRGENYHAIFQFYCAITAKINCNCWPP